jgi:signal transduction histidine kinase
MLLTVVTVTLRKTNRKLQDAQRQLQKHQQELVDTVHARTADLVVMRDQALAASEAKSLFLSKVSHELRTPLNAIIGYTEIIFDELRDGSRRIDVQDVDKVRISALHLMSVITDLLDITRLENGTANIIKTTFSISQMIGDVMSRAQPLAKKNGNRIEIRNHLGHDQVETDKERLQDALDHVINNACKYTHAGTITIDIEQHKDGDDTWLDFRVLDNGIGMSLEQQERIFNVFVQGDDSTTRRFDGLGLGLAKSRGYCRLLGGDITLTTEEGKGSEFVVTIPVKVINENHYQASA